MRCWLEEQGWWEQNLENTCDKWIHNKSEEKNLTRGDKSMSENSQCKLTLLKWQVVSGKHATETARQL